jgi:hypothetical protein
MLFAIACSQITIGFYDADDFDIAIVFSAKDPMHVGMDKAYYADAERFDPCATAGAG